MPAMLFANLFKSKKENQGNQYNQPNPGQDKKNPVLMLLRTGFII
ncbi:hypothetical protein CLV51_11158 [Chitinophaga niastensis]|uniref:Uncharacterized protein n=1 Tax=Chitinophaga niastensis TaxID=536980 RepID=A0A2P8H8W7_CHINA|nr:hypothetical protein CLV51_11158 [Chitinophaga niastensis]